MTKGCINWNDEKIRYNQTTKIIEKFLADLKASKQTNFWLEECNVCSACCAVEGVGGEWYVKLPQINNTEFLSQADIMFDLIYSEKFSMPVTGEGLCENEVPQNLAKAINMLSTAKAEYKEYANSDDMINDLKNSMLLGKSAEISYKTDYGGGHFICIVAYDDSSKEFICYDPWPSNKHCKNGGIKERYSEDFFKERARQRAIIVSK